jgi:hypothetical protein
MNLFGPELARDLASGGREAGRKIGRPRHHRSNRGPRTRHRQRVCAGLGRARALEVMLSAEDYNADFAERYGWINRALPAGELSEFVRLLALRIASFPAAGQCDRSRAGRVVPGLPARSRMPHVQLRWYDGRLRKAYHPVWRHDPSRVGEGVED